MRLVKTDLRIISLEEPCADVITFPGCSERPKLQGLSASTDHSRTEVIRLFSTPIAQLNSLVGQKPVLNSKYEKIADLNRLRRFAIAFKKWIEVEYTKIDYLTYHEGFRKLKEGLTGKEEDLITQLNSIINTKREEGDLEYKKAICNLFLEVFGEGNVIIV